MIGSQDQAGPDALVVLFSRDATLLARRYALGSASVVTVGRNAKNTIVVPSDSVSRSHARFERRADGWWVLDSDSAHGTFVNGKQVQGALLRCGDQVKIGDTIFKLVDAADDGRRIVETSDVPSSRDGLTQAYNRRHLIEQIDRELQRGEHPGQPLALVMLDVDGLQRINDAHGHPAGDEVLRALVSLVGRHLRPGDVLARYGGDELALLLPGTGLPAATGLAEAIRADVAAHGFSGEGRTISLTLSAGVAQASHDTRVAADLIRSADHKLYAAKLRGRR